MSQQRHIIGRTVLDLNTGYLADTWELQETMSHLLQQRAVPALEQLFDRMVGTNEVIRLDQVMVNLGTIDLRSLEDDFVPALVNMLHQTLGDQLANLRRSDLSSSQPSQNRASADWDVLLYFLQYGRLPWWVTETNWQEWLARWQSVMQRDLVWQAPLLELLSTHPSARQRLVTQLPESLRHELLLSLRPKWKGWATLLSQARQLMNTLHLSRNELHLLDTQAWLLILAELQPNSPVERPLPVIPWLRHWLTSLLQIGQRELATPFKPTLESSVSATDSPLELDRATPENKYPNAQPVYHQFVYQRLIATLTGISVNERSIWRTALDQIFALKLPSKPQQSTNSSIAPPQAPDRSPLPDPSAPHTQSSDEAQLSAQAFSTHETPNTFEVDASAPRPNPNLSTEHQPSSPNQTQIRRSTLSPEEDQPKTTDSILSPEEEHAGIYINQAGLVILHPFLATYFRSIELIGKDAFCNELAQQTAIYLLHYLATRQTGVPEYELVLPKLLCGWSLNEPIALNLDLSASALTEAENLLQIVINYWEALKNTSPDGLREGFLQRQGKLTRNHSGTWKLQVERQAIDILLSRLPWGISMVKLPWMEHLLTVEWT